MLEETHPRKRRERKKKKPESECDYDVQEPRYYLRKHPVDKTGDHDNEDEDDDETNEDVDRVTPTPHHERKESHTRWSTIVIFAITSTALVILTGIVFVELKGSQQVSTPIAESRYVNILSSFVEESDGVEEEHAAEVAPESRTAEGEDEDDGSDGGNSEGPHARDVLESQSDEEDQEDEEEEDGDNEDEGDADDSVDSENQRSVAEAVGAEAVTEEQEQVPESRSYSEETDNTPDDGRVVVESYVNEESPSSDTESRDEETVDNQSSDPETLGRDQQEPALLQQPVESAADVEEEIVGGGDDTPYDDNSDITNEHDSQIARQLTDAELELDRSPEKSKQMFENLLQLYPKSPRAAYGKARALDAMSELRKSNKLLDEAIETFRALLDLPDIPKKLFRMAGERCVDRMRFRGFVRHAIKVQRKLIAAFPADVGLRNQMAVSYLLMGENKAAKELLKQVLRMDPEDGFAKVHYGFVLMTDDRDYEGAIKYLGEGIATEEAGTVDGRFYFHLGDALARVGRRTEAYKIYERGAAKGLFISAYQRSLYNENNLTSRPWWSPAQTTYEKHLLVLEYNWSAIRDEGVSLLDEERGGFAHESEGLKDTGTWKQFELFARGNREPSHVRGEKIAANCARAPKTCELVGNVPGAAGCRRGQVKFSIMLPNTHVWPHTGPTNCRLRAHLGLVVPDGARIRVANETRRWVEGKFIIFDDSFEHEVWHEGTSLRLVLIVDFWHPDLTDNQKRTLTSI